jgi:hypothetical protein
MGLLRGLTNSIIRSTTEALKKRTQEERPIDVPEEPAEVVVLVALTLQYVEA